MDSGPNQLPETRGGSGWGDTAGARRRSPLWMPVPALAPKAGTSAALLPDIADEWFPQARNLKHLPEKLPKMQADPGDATPGLGWDERSTAMSEAILVPEGERPPQPPQPDPQPPVPQPEPPPQPPQPVPQPPVPPKPLPDPPPIPQARRSRCVQRVGVFALLPWGPWLTTRKFCTSAST